MRGIASQGRCEDSSAHLQVSSLIPGGLSGRKGRFRSVFPRAYPGGERGDAIVGARSSLGRLARPVACILTAADLQAMGRCVTVCGQHAASSERRVSQTCYAPEHRPGMQAVHATHSPRGRSLSQQQVVGAHEGLLAWRQ